MTELIRIATRKSPLALWQAEHVRSRLKQLYPNLEVGLLEMTTRADKMLDAPLAKVGGKGLFVKELEVAMLEGRADIAVHSMKDVPTEFPEGLELAVICKREDFRDAFVSNRYDCLKDLPPGGRVGTSSLRRKCQLCERFPHLEILNLRGNVNTRLAKLDEGRYDAIILAAAGLIRLEMTDRIRQYIDVETSLPAGGQGAVGIECRSDDRRMKDLLKPLTDRTTTSCVLAERAMNRRLEGGCQVPIACFAEMSEQNAGEEELYVRGLVGDPDGSLVLREEIRGPVAQAESLGVTLAERLLARGADEILKRVYNS